MTTPRSNRTHPAMISHLVPYAHVADVEQSLAFYAIMGFAVCSSHAGPNGRLAWARATSRDAQIMFALASGEINAGQQAVLFYMNCEDVTRLRAHLLTNGVHDGGRYSGQPGPNNGRRVVFNVSHPFYMPAGELRIHDPDGYVLLVGQQA